MTDNLDISQYKFALSIAPVPMLLIAPDGTIVHANESACQLFDYSEEQISSLSVDCLVPDDVRGHHAMLRTAYSRVPGKRQIGQGRELLGLTREGSVLSLELGIEPVAVEEYTLTLLTAVDVSQRKLANQRVHLAIDAADSAMIMCDTQRQITLTNLAAEKLFGYQREELIGQSVDILVPEGIRQCHAVYMRGFMEYEQRRSMGADVDLHALHKDGTRIPVEIALSPVDSPDGKMIVTTIVDLTERKAASRALEAKAEELAALNVELARFAYSTSHELKAPLVTINGLLQASLEDLESGQTPVVIDQLNRALEVCQRAGGTIENVLSIATAHSGEVAIEAVSIATLVPTIWEQVTGHEQCEIDLYCELQVAPVVQVDVGMLKLVLRILFCNVICYKDNNKSVQTLNVAADLRDRRLYVTVTDNGVGIPEAYQAKIFNLFERVNEHSGSGLGLSLARKQIERDGGSISVKSVQGEYTTFEFDISCEV